MKICHRKLPFAGILLLVALSGRALEAPKEQASKALGPLFQVQLAPGIAEQAHKTAEQMAAETLDGRVYVIVSRNSEVEPRFQGPGMSPDAPPIWGIDVNGMRAGTPVELRAGDSRIRGFPLLTLNDLPEGQYFVQAFMNVYETFHRADGSVVQLHMPCGDGHRIMWSTGNIYSDVRKVNVTRSGAPIQLVLSHVISPYYKTPPGGTCQQTNMPESRHLKVVKIKSERLSRFWGRPMYVAAIIILPQGYDDHPMDRYPVIVLMDHHPRAYRFDGHVPTADTSYPFREDGGNSFSRWWLGSDGPRVIVVQPLSENPYYDTSYWVNSPNVGPYGDVLAQELLPAVNQRFRTIDARWARTVTGCSSGGWMAAGAQVFSPDLFGGAFVFSPDVVDFHSLWLINMYEDPNAYWNRTEWRQWPRPYMRDAASGNTAATVEEWANLELAMGNHDRSGEYYAQQEATWGPQGADGYPVSWWDPKTGNVNHDAMSKYRRYDISAYIDENWTALEPKFRDGRLKFFVTETDNYFLNRAVHSLQKRIETLQPKPDAEFTYYPSGPHCTFPITHEQFVDRMVKFMGAQSPTRDASSGPAN